MFVALSKVLDLLLAPLSWALLLLGAAALLRRRPRAPLVLLVASAAVLLLFSAEPVARALAGWAESSAPRTFRPGVVYDVAIVLGGALDAEASRASGRAELDQAGDRAVAALELWREGRARRLLLSAGLLHPRPGEPAEAERLAERLRAWGVPEEAIVLETRSRNTRENAVESARIVRERGFGSVLLVTSAAHMPRALGCFRAVGLEPDALPVDFRGGGGGSWLPRASALGRSTDALREMAGRAAYRLAGYSR
ncbi:MAG TPA: YdcF family protein [Anaeromyxobacteraceae bacterium]|nr:YdcF family protein [Anaeromyxobacteraceae bacterium]